MKPITEKELNSYCCNNCKFLVDNKCTHVNHEEYDADKASVAHHSIEKYLNGEGSTFDLEFGENINNYFLCDNFEEK